MFRDRHDAGRQLAELLGRYAGDERVVVLGIPRGGVVVAGEVASRLDLSLDVVVASKIGAPSNPEYAVGAVDPDGRITANPDAGYDVGELEHLARPVRDKVRRRAELYRGGLEPIDLSGAIAIVVDDGIATGLTVKSALRYVRSQGADRIVLAAPVIAASAVPEMHELADELVFAETPEGFRAVGQFYRKFSQTSDDEVLDVLLGHGYGQ